MLSGARASIASVRSSILGSSTRIIDSVDDASRISKQRRKVMCSSRLSGLGVRDIPIFSHPVFDIARLERGHGHLPVNRILAPVSLR